MILVTRARTKTSWGVKAANDAPSTTIMIKRVRLNALCTLLEDGSVCVVCPVKRSERIVLEQIVCRAGDVSSTLLKIFCLPLEDLVFTITTVRCPSGSGTLGLGSSIFTDCGCVEGRIDVSTTEGRGDQGRAGELGRAQGVVGFSGVVSAAVLSSQLVCLTYILVCCMCEQHAIRGVCFAVWHWSSRLKVWGGSVPASLR